MCINFGIHPANWKIAKVIMLHKAGKPEDLGGSYSLHSLTSCLSKLLEKAVADYLSNWAEANKKFNKQQNGIEKTGAQRIIYLNFLKQLNMVSVRATQLQEYFLMSRKPLTKYGMTVISLS